MSADPMRPMDNASDSPSYVAGPIAPRVSAAVSGGVAPASHPELRASHPDAAKARVADQSDYTSVGHGSSDPVLLARRALYATAPSRVLNDGLPGVDE